VTDRSFWQPPAASLLQAGGDGELVIARIRSVLTIAGMGVSLLAAWRNPMSVDVRIYQQFFTLAVSVSLVLHLVVRRADYGWWLGFTTSIVDVTLISAGLTALLVAGTPASALNSTLLFPAYFYALAATTVRLDHRACLVAGLVASLQYLLIVAYGAFTYGLDAPFVEPETQVVRIGLLLGMAAIGVIVNRRMQIPHVLSANDSLTGLLNRHAFDDRWNSEVARARRYGRPISIAVLDIDYFKQFNDRHGHGGGDTALELVASTLRSRVRATDFVGRMGGEEFVVALPETGSSAAVALVEGLRKAVAETMVVMPGNRAPASVTISAGVASWPEHGEEITRLMERADDRMYEAKLDGRNRVKGPVLQSSPLGVPIPF
jgi:diguanylate cyclase (GGDEF)-like protein